MPNIKTCADFTDDHCALHPQCHGCPAHIDEPKKYCKSGLLGEDGICNDDGCYCSTKNCPSLQPMTNYDRIRNMSVEKMAEFILMMAIGYCSGQVPKNIKEWLETEVTE